MEHRQVEQVQPLETDLVTELHQHIQTKLLGV